MPVEGVNDCSATNSTHFVVVERVCADSGEKLSAEKNSCYVRACVFILANVLMCLTWMLALHTCVPYLFLLSFSYFHQYSLLTYTYTHNSEECVKAAPNVWASRHTAGLAPSLPAASS